ncbi:hypothetical protein LSTR_LSTR000398 [Laodelphax striatellus]|uniref:Folded gastrulation N-terminal domain-containing protein n=1 Tax=Laodelphax striatellus TaxID=195883 RepID=A0A482X3S3_LAOST|nr:hypothetical protein LSTR_LSTR000398 [Laodelphax striatellus]
MAVGKLMILPVILFLHFGLLHQYVTASPIPSSPVRIDQRQEGETNVRADLSNIVVVVIPSDGVKLVDTESMGTLLQLFANKRRTAAGLNKTPPPPSSPYKVDIEQSAIDKLHADMESLNSIIPASKTYDDKEERAGESDIPVIKEQQKSESSIVKEDGKLSEEEKVNKETTGEATSAAEVKKPEVVGDVKPEEMDIKDVATMTATTMEAIVSSVNSYSKNEGMENGEKLVKLQPAAVTVILAKKPETSGDVPVVTSSTVLAGEKKEPTQFVEIHKQSSSVAPSKDMPSPLSLTIEDLKRPIQVPSEEITGKTTTPVKIMPKDSKPQQRHHGHQHQQTSKPTKKPVATEAVEQSPSPTAPTKTAATKSSKPDVSPQEHERKLKMLQSGIVFCLPGQMLGENGECINGQIRQSRREDMERLLAALRFGVGPAYKS